jgi:hypothetical protein
MPRDLEAIVDAFRQPTELREDWNHVTQLAIAAWYVRRWPRDVAEERHRADLLAYLAVCGSTPRFNETMTAAWFALVAGVVADHGPDVALEAIARDLAARYPDGTALLRWWSPGILRSDDAKARWIPPDRATFP